VERRVADVDVVVEVDVCAKRQHGRDAASVAIERAAAQRLAQLKASYTSSRLRPHTLVAASVAFERAAAQRLPQLKASYTSSLRPQLKASYTAAQRLAHVSYAARRSARFR
jgi:hypothetical protein